MMNHWVMDYETLSNCFLGVFEHYKTDEVKVYTVGKLRNDLPEFIEFLKQNKKNNEWHISFNGLSFDAQITQFIIVNYKKLLAMDGEQAGRVIYEHAQSCIDKQNQKQFQTYSENKLSIKQIDVFKLNHWDNPAKRSSLKSIQVAMDWHNVQDMPIHHSTEITTVEQLKEVAKYCRNDVASTKKIMQLCTGKIQLRGVLTDTYGKRLYSASEAKIVKELFLMFMAEKSGANPYEMKKLRTFRRRIKFRDIILPYINFNEVPVFAELLSKFKDVSLDPQNTRGGFKHSVQYRGLKTDFGLGGVHGAKKGVFTAKEGMTIMSSDVVSFYPRMAMVNGWAPAHLPQQTFREQYQWFFDERRKIPKSNPKNYVYKIILNTAYGLSNDINCFLYDPEFTMRITVNGQLSLMMLYVMLCESIDGAIPVMQNTDGLEMIIPENQKTEYLKICARWEEITGLELEHDQYQKLVIPDVNTYIGIFKYREVDKDVYDKLIKDSSNLVKEEDGKYYNAPIKCKGRFEYKDLALHKNKSFLIVRKALYHYFVHGIEPEDYLKSNRNIFDYCGAVKIRGNWRFEEHYIENEKTVNLNVSDEIKSKVIEEHGFVPAYEKGYWIKPEHDIYKVKGWKTNFVYTEIMKGVLVKKPIQNTIRYYISNNGSKIIKVNNADGREIQTESGKWLQTVFNIYEEKPWDEYNVNDQYYLEKINKEIRNLTPEKFNTQMSLF